jgi:hypothetical protein
MDCVTITEKQFMQIKGALKLISDQCLRKCSCEHCDFEKVRDDGSGICKFRLEAGYPGFEIMEIFSKENQT